MRVAALICAALICAGCSSEKPPDSYKVKFETSKGDFVVTVTRDWSPLGADRFYTLVKSGFYDGARFFRVLPGFVAQFGIAAAPAVTAKWREANLTDDPVKQSNKRGTITFATGGPNTRTTQVFINLADNERLDPRGFSPFGAVSQGMEVVDQFYSGYGEGAPSGNGPDQKTAESDGNAYLSRDFPKLDYIKKATVEK
jgi:peptidyl-prolyl cis-trans isomerase A (cyclophilin A)